MTNSFELAVFLFLIGYHLLDFRVEYVFFALKCPYLRLQFRDLFLVYVLVVLLVFLAFFF